MMEEYFVRADREQGIIKIKTEKLELRDGALIFYLLDETEGYKIVRIIAAGEWLEIIKVIEDGDDDENN